MNLAMFFGNKRKARKTKAKKAKRSPGRKPTRSGMVKSLPKSKAYVMVRTSKGTLRRRKLYLGKNGALYYRTKSGRQYVKKSVLRRKNHVLSPKKLKRRKARKAGRKTKSAGKGKRM